MKGFLKNIDLKIFILSMLGVGFISFGISYFSGMTFLIIFPILALAMIVNGFIATWEDNRKGGFNSTTESEQD